MPSPSTPPASTPVRGTRETSEAVRQACINVAIFDGVKWGTVAAVASGGAVLLTNRSSRAFRSYLGLSGKIACVMIPTSGAFFLSSELTLLAAQRDPSAFGIVVPAQPMPVRSASEAAADAEAEAAVRAVVAAAEEKELKRREVDAEKAAAGGGADLEGKDLKKETSDSGKAHVVPGQLMTHHLLANFMYDHPFHLLVASSLPVVGSIFVTQKDHAHLKLSQKIMHTRVLGQLSVLGILLSVMFFRDYMDRNGRFIESDLADQIKKFEMSEDALIAHDLIQEAAYLKK